MTHDNPATSYPSLKNGAEKRNFQRHAINLRASFRTGDGIEFLCTLRDFCIGGMLLEYQPLAMTHSSPQKRFLATGDVISIRCALPAPGKSGAVQFQARVVRAVENSIGVAFINPDPAALQAMQDFALRRDEDKTIEQSAPLDWKIATKIDREQTAKIIHDCNRATLHALQEIINSTLSIIPSRMFQMAQETKDVKAQNAYFNSSDTIKCSTPALANSLRARIQKQLENFQPPHLAAQHKSHDLCADEMSLVEDNALEEWLLISEINNQVEIAHKSVLVSIERRLSVVFDTAIERDNNPYAPRPHTETFFEAIKCLGLDPIAAPVCYGAFKEELLKKCGALYRHLNAILLEAGVLPDLKHHAPRSGDSTAPVRPAQRTNAPSAPNTGTITRELYQLVHELRDFQRETTNRTHLKNNPKTSPHDDSLAAMADSPAQSASEFYKIADLLLAVGNLQTARSAQADIDNEPRDIKHLVLSALSKNAASDAGKQISARDNSIMEVVGDLFHAIQGDPLVADSVRPWLRRLELPMLRLAFQDSTIFHDRSHVARQVFNKIARMEVYDDDKTSAGQSAIRNVIDRLIDRINNEFDGTAEIFGKIESQLDRLIKIQNQAYTDNLRDVIAECEHSPPRVEPENHTENETGELFNKWLKQAHRMQEGDWALFMHDNGKTQRLRIAWIGNGTHVFVNWLGLKEKMLNIADVAREMGKGKIVVLDNADDPVTDRAQYGMLQELHEQLIYETTHDHLTGLINRKEFESRLAGAVQNAWQENLRHVMFFIDIDKFSAINNSCGYESGDKLLKELTALLQEKLGDRGILARLGSDEFGILMENCSLDDALDVAEQQIDAVTGYRFEWDDKRFSVALSVGLVPVNINNSSVTELLRAAESSCSVAKDMGGNRLQVYHSGHSRLAHRSEVMKWVGHIDKILEEERLSLRCQRIQPINGDPSARPHFEILLSVKDDHGKIVSPQDFIQAAEWYRRMTAVDQWVVEKTFNWMAGHRDTLEKINAITINLSGHTLSDDSFIDFLLDQMARTAVPPDKLCFEVTETAGVSNLSDAAGFIMEVKKTGCKFALDDFGSGMSSYAYLKNLPIDLIKIDGAFVKNIEHSPSDHAVVKSITEIGHFMNKKIVAEYVENDAILNLLREIGVDYAQGHVIAKPDLLDSLAIQIQTS